MSDVIRTGVDESRQLDEVPQQHRAWPDSLCRALAGLDTAVLASFGLLLWLAAQSMLDGQFWWSRFNVAASPFYGGAVFRMGFSRATLTGLSLLLLTYAALGVLFGLWFRPRSFLGTWVRALVAAMAWHVFADRWFWPLITPYARSYFSPLVMLAGHTVWAVLLLRYPSRYQAIEQTFGAGRSIVPAEPGAAPQANAGLPGTPQRPSEINPPAGPDEEP